VLGETEDDIKLAIRELIRSAKTIGFEINEYKTKYMCITREQPQNTSDKEYSDWRVQI
jgi:hypothetical protein